MPNIESMDPFRFSINFPKEETIYWSGWSVCKKYSIEKQLKNARDLFLGEFA